MRKINRKDVIFDIIGAAFSNILDSLSSMHIGKGLPQMAILSYDHIGTRINIFGQYEKNNLLCLEDLIRAKKLGSGVCLDVGANIGNHSIFFSRYFEHVHAFEPAELPFELLKINARQRSNIQCHRIGLSDRCTKLTLTTPVDNIGMGTLSANINSNQSFTKSEVQVVTLDSIEHLRNLKIEIIKIDVEGHELSVLNGAKITICKNTPIIAFEQQKIDIYSGTSAVIERLREYGYIDFYCYSYWSRKFPKPLGVIFRILFGDKVKLSKISSFENKYYSMIFAVPNSK